MTAKTRQVHERKPLEYRKGKKRLCTLTIPQLEEIVNREKKGKHFEAARKEIVRKHKVGVTYNRPTPKEESNEESQSA